MDVKKKRQHRSYVIHKCMDCGYKEMFINGTSDGKRCSKCNSRLFIPIDAGSKEDLMLRQGE